MRRSEATMHGIQANAEENADEEAGEEDADEELESSLLEKRSQRRCTQTGSPCRRRRFNQCSVSACGGNPKSYYRAPKSHFHCTGCKNLALMFKQAALKAKMCARSGRCGRKRRHRRGRRRRGRRRRRRGKRGRRRRRRRRGKRGRRGRRRRKRGRRGRRRRKRGKRGRRQRKRGKRGRRRRRRKRSLIDDSDGDSEAGDEDDTNVASQEEGSDLLDSSDEDSEDDSEDDYYYPSSFIEDDGFPSSLATMNMASSADLAISLKELQSMTNDQLAQLVGVASVCSLATSFEGCASARKLYRCGKCWKSKWYPKKKPKFFNPYRGPPGPPGRPGHASSLGGLSTSRGRRRRRGKGRRRRRRRAQGALDAEQMASIANRVPSARWGTIPGPPGPPGSS